MSVVCEMTACRDITRSRKANNLQREFTEEPGGREKGGGGAYMFKKKQKNNEHFLSVTIGKTQHPC